MWRSRVIAARRFRSACTNAVTGFPHSISEYSPQLHSKVTLVSDTNSKSFRSLSNCSVRFFSSSLLDSVTHDNVAPVSTDTNNDKNDSRSVIDIEKLDEVKYFLGDVEYDADIKLSETILDEMDLDLSEEFVIKVLEEGCYNIPPGTLVGFYRWAIRGKNQHMFSATTRSLDALIKPFRHSPRRSYKKGVFSLWELVQEIGETKKGVVTTEILNTMISQLSHHGEDTDGFEVFDKFGDFSCETNAQTYYEAIDSFCSPELIGEPVGEGRVRIVFERLISEGKLMEPLYVGFMISSLCEAGMAKEAHSLYLLAKKNKKTPPLEYVKRLFNSLCDGKMIDSDSVCLGLNMLHEIHGGDERKYEIKQFSCVIQALCEVNALEGAKSLLTNLNDDVPPPGNAVYNTVISYVVKSGDTTEAVKIMRIMEDRGLKPDLFTYSEIMSGYIKGGEIQNAVKMFSEAKKNHGNLTPDMYHMVIFVYCRLKKFEKAVKLLEEMEVYGIQPNTDEYDELITSICLKALKASDYGMAERLMAKMAKRGLHLNELRKAGAV